MAIVVMLQPAFGLQLITNGGFETGDLTGWTELDQPGGAGTFYAWNTTIAPDSFLDTAGPNSGSWYALSDAVNQGCHVLLQSFTVPASPGLMTLSYSMFVNNWQEQTFIQDLDYTQSPNQHTRVDILTAGADPFSTAASDIMANLYLGSDPFATMPNAYTDYSFNLSFLTKPLMPGNTYQLRFADVETEFFLNTGIDDVSLTGGGPEPPPIPEPGTMCCLALGLIALGAARRRKKA